MSKEFYKDALIGERLYQAKTKGVQGILKDYSAGNTFWRVVEDQEIAMHNPIVHVVINRYVSIVNNLINGINIEDRRIEKIIEKVLSKENEQSLDRIVREATRVALIQGDACLKIEYDADISDEPLITLVEGLNVEYKTKKGRIVEAVFYTEHFDELDNKYILEEYRGRGYIKYLLKDTEGKIVPMGTVEELKDVEDVEYEGEALFIPVKFSDHPIDKERGKPLFYDKVDMLNVNDEAGSKVNTVMRNSEPYTLFNEKVVMKEVKKNVMSPMGRITQVPEKVRKPYKGSGVLVFNDEMTGDGKFPDMVDFVNINPHASDYETFKKMALDDVLLGIMSPETLGIESRTLEQNATAQKDREQITADNANNMVSVLEDTLKLLIRKILVFKKHLLEDGTIDEDTKVEINTIQYQTMSFKERAEIVKDLRAFGMSNISRYEAVRLLFPDKSETEIEEEIERIQREMGDGGINDEYLITDEMIDTKYEDLNI